MKNDDSRKRVFQGLSSDYPMVNSQYIRIKQRSQEI